MTTYHVTLNKSPNGLIVAECPSLPGCAAQGRSEQEAIDNIKEAITSWMWNETHHATPLSADSPQGDSAPTH
jgi:predicted RNase H-like HicB family nuclease